uniref:Protein MON2 homolog n=1 Tax=Saccoglossus kowalevskii TaxID=10224 RepID=A0ABM0MYM9_SACKO|nr:PREDICTED: protein MON2 homolog [Saccoglossus kowalevskii]
MTATQGPSTKLLDSLQTDLRALSNEAKRKYPPVKEAAEAGILKIKTLMAKNRDIIPALVACSGEILQPFLLGCDTKNIKIVQICLVSVQKLIIHEALSEIAARNVVNMLWSLMDHGIEEVKVLQTLLVLLTTNTIVKGDVLSKAIVICFRLHFFKDSTTSNTASATVRQVVSIVFERVVAGDESNTDVERVEADMESQKSGSKDAPVSLYPCARDAYLLFQDLCYLVNADQPYWLVGMTEMTRTFGLELLESILNRFPPVFLNHTEFSFLLKERVCPLVIKLFSPSIKYKHGIAAPTSPSPVEKPYFPISMRLLRVVSVLLQKYYNILTTECEIFLSLLVKFLDGDKPMWQRALAMEVLHRLCVHPQLLRSFCENYDMKEHSSKVFRDIVNGLGSFIQSLFVTPMPERATSTSTGQTQHPGSTAPAMVGNLPVGGGVTPQPAFVYRGIWIPLVQVSPSSSTKPMYLEMLEKTDPPTCTIQDGYAMSVAFNTLLDIVKGVSTVITTELEIEQEKEEMPTPNGNSKTVDAIIGEDIAPELRNLWECLVNSSWCGILASLSLLLDASTDETATESILKSMQVYASLCGKLNLNVPRDAFITSLCKSSLPPHYALTVLNIQQSLMSSQSSSSSSSQQGAPAKALWWELDGHKRTSSKDNLLNMSSYTAADAGAADTGDSRNQVVAVGTPLSTVLGTQQGPVMLTAKNLQCMRTILSVAHCHGAILGTAWHLVLSTLQHLTWILGLKPASGGSLKVGSATDGPNAVITTAVMAELPILSAMLSRLFESSQYLDDVALHHLIDALCKLSCESMELAYANREPSLFAVAKLLETGLVNLPRIDILWTPVTGHLLDVCQHPHQRMREWGAEAVTALVKAAMAFKYEPPLHQNLKLQGMLLSPLQELSNVSHPDIRQKQLECVLQVIQDNGETLEHGWPLILGVIGDVTVDQGENLIRIAFQSLQLVVNDFLPMMPSQYLQVCVEVASKFGLQTQELNISLTSIGLLWNIADYLYQNRNKIKVVLEKEAENRKTSGDVEEDSKLGRLPPSDTLWLCLYSKLADMCVDPRPAVRKSAGQTLFSTISAHGSLLDQLTWQTVLWQVLFPLLDRVHKFSGAASTDKSEMSAGNILIHHSRDTAEKQWAETRVLSLAGVARVFNTWRYALKPLGDYPRAWALLLEHIESAALSTSSEVSLAALQSFQEILQIKSALKKDQKDSSAVVKVFPSDNAMGRPNGAKSECIVQSEDEIDPDDISLWSNAWRVWHSIGIHCTTPPESNTVQFLPSQPFLTALVEIFPPLFEHIKQRFVSADLYKLCMVLRCAVSAPVSSETSPFIIPSYFECEITSLQESTLQAIDVVQKAIKDGPENMKSMYPAIFNQLLTFVSFACQPPNYGKLETKTINPAETSKQERWANFRFSDSSQPEWIAMNYVPFAEKSLQMVVELYRHTATHQSVIEEHVLQNIIKTLQLPLGMKYGCPSQTTWKLAIRAQLEMLYIALPVARQHHSDSYFTGMWSELSTGLDHFLFSPHCTPPNLSIDEFQEHESIDIQVVQLLRDEVLPYPSYIPKPFMAMILSMLNRGSIHSSKTTSFTDSSRQLREEFAKACFETLLQFSYITKSVITNEGSITKMALSALLTRCQEVLKKYVEDEKLSGKCPLPRPRMSEMAFVLKAVGTLLDSLKKAKPGNVDSDTWKQVIGLYPYLVDCTTCTSSQVCKALKEVLHHYYDLLAIPSTAIHNSTM